MDDERDRKVIRNRKLRALIEKRDLRLFPKEADFAHHLGMGGPVLSQIKGRHRELGEEIADRIEDALRLPRGWLDYADAPLDADENALIQAYRMAGAETRGVMLNAAHTVLEANRPKAECA